jgi:hypothetical protein
MNTEKKATSRNGWFGQRCFFARAVTQGRSFAVFTACSQDDFGKFGVHLEGHQPGRIKPRPSLSEGDLLA